MINNQCDDVFFALASYSANREVVLQKANDPLVRLIAALPFIAHCSHPQRISALHTNAYFLMAQKGYFKTVFSHDALDDENLVDRLHPLNCFYDGNIQIITRGMNILLLVMIQDYIADARNDSLEGKYNPVTSGAWQAETIREKLISEIESIQNPEMEQIFPLEMVKERKFWED